MEETEKARDKAEQEGYDIGVAETEKTIRVEVSGVCRNYCLQVWNEALNQAEVEASFALKRVESVYYPSAIRTSSSANSKADTSSEVAELGKGTLAKAFPNSSSMSEEAQQQGVVEKEADADKGVAPDATKPQLFLKIHLKRKRCLPQWR